VHSSDIQNFPQPGHKCQQVASSMPDESAQVRFLIVGRTGWIANMVAELLEQRGERYAFASFRLEQREACERELDALRPQRVLNCAGVTGRPNVDWCEDHRRETVRSNVLGVLNLADCCASRGIHLTNFATGCLYHYDDGEHRPTAEGGRPFTEDDPPNFFGSYYSRTKAMVEELLRSAFDNVLILRLRMPVSDDLSPRSFVTKIARYEKVVNIPNSMTVLTELLPVALDMSERGLTGVYNFTNPGSISHNEVLELYRKYIDPKFQWKNFTLEEQAKILKAGRSNCELDVRKLLRDNPGAQIREVHAAMEEVFRRMQAKGVKPLVAP
jgi:3,5-epimerase/4-reductase